MSLPDELISTVGPIVESVAADMCRRYRHYGMGQDDASQDGWVWCYGHPRKVIEWFDPDLTEPSAGQKMLAQALRNELHDIGESLKAQHVGYSRDDLTYYSRNILRELLPSMFEEEAWIHPEQSDGGERRQRSVPAEGGNWVATLADVSRAYDQMEEEDRDLLFAFHSDGLSNKLMAEMHDISEQTMSYRHDRALRRLVDLLGGPKPRGSHDEECDHVGTRRAMSNAAARSIQDSYWEET